MKIKIPERGTYILIKYLASGRDFKVGSLGTLHLKKGFYAYAGSAMGKNGFINRVGRHIRKDKPQRWHIDYLDFGIREVWISENAKRLECEWAIELKDSSTYLVKGFGASDCRCKAHLFYFRNFKLVSDAKKLLSRKFNYKKKKVKPDFSLYKSIAIPEVFLLHR